MDDLKNAVKVVLRHNAQPVFVVVRLPAHPREDELDSDVLVYISPLCRNHSLRQLHVNGLGRCFQDLNLFLCVIEVQLVCKVRAEHVGHTRERAEATRPASDLGLGEPLDELGLIVVVALCLCFVVVHALAHVVHIDSLVDNGKSVVNDFHHSFRVHTQVQALLGVNAEVALQVRIVVIDDCILLALLDNPVDEREKYLASVGLLRVFECF